MSRSRTLLLQSDTALVTGTGGGIGLALCNRLDAQGRRAAMRRTRKPAQ
jgi:NAD(P)-dependent dehydrogenase (short-subunit alcohol dehydrogenase family)